MTLGAAQNEGVSRAVDLPSGLPGLPRLSWGTHICQLYRAADELAEALVPYFTAGLANGERCLWIAAEPFGTEQARAALGRVVEDLDDRLRRGDIQIVAHSEWYENATELTADGAVARWLDAETAALGAGYRGLRLAGNASWLRPEDRAAFDSYERLMHAALQNRRILAVCSYRLDTCSTEEILDVARTHELALTRSDGEWDVTRSATETLAAVGRHKDRGGAHDHDAILFSEDGFPAERVARFIGDGLRGGEAVIVVLGGERSHRVRALLAADGADLEAAVVEGRLEWLDPEEALPSLLDEGGRVDAGRFTAKVVPLVARLREQFGRVRAYGEMVDVLARRGDFDGAIELERLWNEYLREAPMPLLCTYDSRAFVGGDGSERFQRLHHEHRHLHLLCEESSADILRTLVHALADRTRALDDEAYRRAHAEQQRDRWQAASLQAAGHLRRLQEVTAALLGVRSAAELGTVAAVALPKATGCTSMVLAMSDGPGHLREVCHAGDMDGPLFQLGPGSVLDEVLQSGRPLLLGSPEAVALRWPALEAGRTPTAWAGLPCDAAGERVGILALGFATAQAFLPSEQALYDDLARHAALALQRAQLVTDLQQARLRAEQACRAKDEFLAMLGHELRNPLSPMTTVVHLMGRREPDLFRKERAILDRQLHHMTHLVDDLLDVSRIAGGKMRLARESVELARIVNQAVELSGPVIEDRGHHLRVDVAADGLLVDADPDRLVQAVTNLLTNAAKYTPPEGHISVFARASGGRVSLSVSDDGQGLDPELAPSVFDLFVQGPRGLARTEGGLGLGLAITRSIVEMHGGTIRVESPGIGMGATFSFDLPHVAAAASATGTGAGSTSRHAHRVLVVDDSADAAETLADVLRISGCEVVTAYDAEEAQLAAARTRPEIALIDIGLPVVDGWELGRRLMADDPDGTLQCLALTGYGSERDQAESRAAGFVAHLTKPVDPEDLERIIFELGRPPSAACRAGRPRGQWRSAPHPSHPS